MSEQKPEQIEAQPAVLQATIQIIRANTGKVETYQITGTPLNEPKKEAQ